MVMDIEFRRLVPRNVTSWAAVGVTIVALYAGLCFGIVKMVETHDLAYVGYAASATVILPLGMMAIYVSNSDDPYGDS